jgi:fatty-acyl-CoA synthase
LAPKLGCVRQWVSLSDHGQPPATALPLAGDYEALVAAAPTGFRFPDLDENTVATLFYTTGTTGDPKGVFFTHRQIVLHTLTVTMGFAAQPGPVTLHAADIYLPLTPMFHVHAWGIPYIATMLGLKQVYPGRYEPQLLSTSSRNIAPPSRTACPPSSRCCYTTRTARRSASRASSW